MSPRSRRRMARFVRTILRGLGGRRGWGDGPRVVPLRGGTSGHPDLHPGPSSLGALLSAVRGQGPHADLGSDALARLFDEEPRYSVRPEGQNLRRFTARGDQPRLTQVLLEAARSLTGSLGLVLVEVHGQPREWTAVDLDRSRLLEGLMELRDLLGQGCLDMAIFSSDESVEVFLDRFMTLEIRCGGWHEPRFRGLLEGQGFARVDGLSPLPLSYEGSPLWSQLDARRVEEVCARLGLEPVADTPDANDAG